MTWRSRTSPFSTMQFLPTRYQKPAASPSAECVPKWVEILPAAGGIWSMIKTLRERGNHEIADKLQLAAEKQAEAHLRTEQILSRRRSPKSSYSSNSSYSSSAARTPARRETTPSSAPNEKESSKNNWGNEEDCKTYEVESHEEEEEETRSRLTIPVSLVMQPPTPLPRSPAPEPETELSSGIKVNLDPLTRNPNSCYHNRLDTYSNSKFRWTSPSPSELAEAGFYFIGPSDCVQCFSCETCQKHWKPAEDPWVRHTRRSPSCDYVIESRGEDFIAKILSEVKQLAYSRSGSNTSLKGKQEDNVPEFTKMKNGLLNTQAKLRETRRPSSSGWRLDPYKERNVGGTASRKKKN
ncbi:uncharacterized protein LOC111699210 isoform X2 [Eurytemora carolleeae]|uniref:uncharacterized protein LOC111699210 isoform X2 n=1 Tax=Eurytemora carolleeae TaxID=1294199 RepID=UPI000C78AAEF|nr:uncharacterized protein LOC111699210 isoform X2 [Eurytemora carolleeae]|eukprot:XP_023325589.1 uncharacterized protein LOC111699210 isoform X2 [Eurytemora affinis]